MKLPKWQARLVPLAFAASMMGAGAAYAAKPQPTPTPPPSCTNCWLPATGLSGGTAVDLLWRYVLKGGSPVETVFAAVQGGTSPGVYKSTNGGEAFSLVTAFTTPYALARVSHSISDNGRLFVATTAGLHYSDDLRRWTKVAGGLPSNLSVTWVGIVSADSGFQMYCTVNPSRLNGGLYRSLDEGASWTMVQPFADVRAITSSLGCVPIQNRLLAAVHLSAGSPIGAVYVSDDDGASWIGNESIPSFHTNDVLIDCGVGGTSRYAYVTNDENGVGAIWKSTDLGGSWTFDDSGIAVTRGSQIPGGDPRNVATLGAGIYTRICGADGACNPTWTQFSTTGLGNLNVLTALKAGNGGAGGASRYVAGTPSGVFYFEPAP